MKRCAYMLFILLFPLIVLAQPELIWTSADYDNGGKFLRYTETEYRWSCIETGVLSVMDATFGDTPVWSIPVSNDCRHYSTWYDVTGDNLCDIYLCYSVNNEAHLDIIDMSNGEVYFALSDPQASSYYMWVADFDSDGELEMDVEAFVDGDQVHYVYSTDGSTALAESGSYTLPDAVNLAAPWPNPTNAGGRVSFSLESPMNVKLQVYSIEGRLVRDLANQTYTAGTHQLFWDGKSDSGVPVASGSYYLSLQAGDNQPAVKQMIILK